MTSSSRIHRLPALILAALIPCGIAVTAWPFAASATEITEPASNPLSIPVNSKGDAEPFTVASTGWSYHQLVYIEICDGKPAAAPGWNPGLDCDNQTSPSPVAANAAGDVVFPATNSNLAIIDFRGASPDGQFNCISASEMPRDATSGDYGSRLLSNSDTRTPDGVTLNPGTPAWTRCQLRVSSNDAYATADQRFITLLTPASSPRTAGEPGSTSAGSTGGANAGASGGGSGNAATGSDPTGTAGRRDPIGARLANTGLDPVQLLQAGGGLIATGVVLLAGAARRRHHPG